MNKPAPTFRSIGTPLEVDDAALEKLNDALSVPTLVKSPPKPAATPENLAEEEASAVGPSAGSQKQKNESRVKKSASATVTPLKPTEKLTVELPGYLTDAMKREALERRTSIRHVVMLGLQALGLKIEPEDLVPDARRTRHKTAKP